jgi:hypothetical protein
MVNYQLTTGGVLRDDGTYIPNNAANRDWQAYQAWLAVPNTPTAAYAISFDGYQLGAVATVNTAAEGQRGKWVEGGQSGAMLVRALRYAEATAIATDGSPTNDHYKMLAAEIGTTGASLVLVGTNVRTELETLKTGLAAIEAVRVVKVAAVMAAGSKAAIDAILAGITWP